MSSSIRRSANRTSWTKLALFGLLVLTTTAHAQRASELDRIVAVVNEDVIVLSELEARMSEVLGQLQGSGTQPPSEAVLRRQVLERLIVRQLQLQLAKLSGVRIEDEALNRTIQRIATQNKLTLPAFREVLERDGYDYGKYREQIREEMLIARVVSQRVESRVQVSAREIDNFLRNQQQRGGAAPEYRVGHILVSLPEGASPESIREAKAKAQVALNRLRAGERFEELAVELSDGRQAFQGGDLGWRKATELPQLFADALQRLAPGETSDVLRSPSGFHILRLIELRGAGSYVVEQTRARQILLRTTELVNDQEAERRLAQLRERVQNGESFENLARAHSDDTASAMRGGDLDWINPGDTLPAFERAMSALKPGETSKPFQTQLGWHIVQVLERRKHDDTRQVQRGNAAEQIRKRKLDEEYQTWIRQLRDEAYVELRLDE